MQPDVARIAEATEDRSAAGIAAAVNRLISSGELSVGARLPTVRDLARALGTSPTTVGEAWRSLIRVGAVRTEGRNGSFVAEGRRTGFPTRFWRIAAAAGEFALDLSAGVPDPALLPDPYPLLAATRRGPALSGYLDPPVLPELERAIRALLDPTGPPDAVTVVDGSLDAVDRVLAGLVRLGDRVVVENPTFPPLLDLLELVGAVPVPVPVDAEGPTPDGWRSALSAGPPVLALLQPRAHNPTGAALSPARAAALAAALDELAPACVTVEDDHVGDIAVAPPVSLAGHRPQHTVRIRSFSKSHGPDLRLAAVAGPSALVEPLVARRSLGPAWSSRLLQRLLADMLADEGCAAAVTRARHTYVRRREALTAALADRGIEVLARDGFNVWVPVAAERDALVLLAARGIGAAPGRPFLAAPLPGEHLRITTATLPEASTDQVADALAGAGAPRNGAPSR